MGRRRQRFDAGRWQVARERCRIEDARPPLPVPAAPAIADVIPGIMKRLGLEDLHWLDLLRQDWTAVVGPAVAAHSRPGGYVNGRLTVFVDSPVWLHELARMRPHIQRNVLGRLGPGRVTDLAFQLDPDPPA